MALSVPGLLLIGGGRIVHLRELAVDPVLKSNDSSGRAVRNVGEMVLK